MRKLWLVAALAFVTLLPGCGYNTIQTSDEQVKAAWGEVLNQYQRRADLIPNLVNTVKGFAQQEQEVLTKVVEARAQATSIQATPELVNNPEAFAKFQAAQGELTGALSRLMVVVENYPQLKSDQNFRDLQAQLEGTENRITVARNRFIQSVQQYNNTVRQFPSNLTAMMFGYKVKPTFAVENEAAIAAPPKVDFGKTPPAPPAAARAGGQVSERMSRFVGSLLLAVALLGAACARAEVAVPPLQTRVTDLTGTLTAPQRQALEDKLAAFEAAKGSQIAVLIVPTTEPESIEQYALRVAERWKLGTQRASTMARSCSLRRTTAGCASKSATGSKACFPTRARSASCPTSSRRTSVREISTAASTPGVDRMIRVIEGEPLPPAATARREW